MGPLAALGAIIPGIVSAVAGIPMMLGGMADNTFPQRQPPPSPLQSGDPFGGLNQALNRQSPGFGTPQGRLVVDTTLGNFGGFGSGGISDKYNTLPEENPAEMISKHFTNMPKFGL